MIVSLETRQNCAVYRRAVGLARARIAKDARATSGAIRRFLEVAEIRFLHAGNDVATIARETGIHRNSLHPGFNRVFGTAPWTYLRERRFDVARVLLHETGLAIWKVGCLVGYNDARTFSRAYAQTVGRTPTHERQRALDDGRRNPRLL